jgi:hypothetical protein
MGQAIPRQHPAVVLRSHFSQLRALLAIALVAVAGLTTAVVILANDSNEVSSTSSAKPIESINYGSGVVNPSTGYPSATIRPDSPGTRYDGGPEEGTRGVVSAGTPSVDPSTGTRYDGGPEEGTRGLGLGGALGARYDGGPEEGSADVSPARAPNVDTSPGARYDGGPEEGSADVNPAQP